MVLGMLFENFKNYYILRYVIYEFLKKVLGVPQPTCLVRVFCAVLHLVQNGEYRKESTESKAMQRIQNRHAGVSVKNTECTL